MDEDLCGHIIRTPNYVWVCSYPRDNHPTVGNTDQPSHYMIPRDTRDE